MLTVERLEDGEVSPYLVDELRTVTSWSCAAPSAATSSGRPRSAGRCCLSPAAPGVVPFRSMLRHHRAVESTVPVRLLYSARSLAEVIYREELTEISAHGVTTSALP